MSPDALRRAAPIILIAAIVAAWEISVRALHVPAYFLPRLSGSCAPFKSARRLLLGSALITLKITLGAFFLAVACGDRTRSCVLGEPHLSRTRSFRS